MELLIALVEPWAAYYADHPTLATAIIACHILAMFIGGGMAVTTDRAIWRSAAGSADAARAILADLSATHTIIQRALVAAFATGLALLATDVATFVGSPVYWTKMAAIAVLIANGARMRVYERRVVAGFAGTTPHTAEMPLPGPVAHWSRVKQSAAISAVLWVSIVVLGVVLSNS